MGSGYGSLNRQINNRVGGIKKSAPYETLTPVQDGEEEFVSLASGFDNEVDPFAIEQAPVTAFVIGGPVNLNADGIDLNAKIATNKYGGALKYSELSDGDKAIVDARRATGQDATPDAYKGATALMNAVDYGSGTQYDTAEEALNGLSGFLGDISSNRETTDEEFNTRNYDPSEFTMAGVSTKGGVSGRAATNSAMEYITKNNIPLSIEVDGQTRYLTTGLGADVYRADKDFEYEAGSYEDFGPIGTYSTLHVDPESVMAGMPLPLRVALAVGTGGVSEGVIAATKGIAGETLHAGDYLAIALPALEYANILVPPVDAVSADIAKGIEAAPAVAGKGVLGLGYNSSKALLTGVVTGDPVEAVTEAYGPALVKKALDDVGVGEALNTFASNNNINADDLNAGINKTIKSLAQGDDIEDAVLKGVGKYVLEGGTILPDVVEDALGAAAEKIGDLVEPVTTALSAINKDYIKPVTSKVGDVLSAVDTEARDLLSAVDDNVIQPLTSEIGDVLSQADTAVRQGAAEFDKEVLQPFTQPAGDVIEDVAQATGDVIEDVAQATGDVAEDVGQVVGDVAEDVGQVVGDVAEDVGQEVGDALSTAETVVRQILEDIDLPDIDLPDIDLPDIDLPDIDLPDIDLPDIDLPVLTRAPSATRTTGGLFDVAQFEHDKGISLVGNLLTGLTEQDAKKLSKKQFQQPKEEMVDLLSDPFANAFNYKV